MPVAYHHHKLHKGCKLTKPKSNKNQLQYSSIKYLVVPGTKANVPKHFCQNDKNDSTTTPTPYKISPGHEFVIPSSATEALRKPLQDACGGGFWFQQVYRNSWDSENILNTTHVTHQVSSGISTTVIHVIIIIYCIYIYENKWKFTFLKHEQWTFLNWRRIHNKQNLNTFLESYVINFDNHLELPITLRVTIVNTTALISEQICWTWGPSQHDCSFCWLSDRARCCTFFWLPGLREKHVVYFLLGCLWQVQYVLFVKSIYSKRDKFNEAWDLLKRRGRNGINCGMLCGICMFFYRFL